MANQESLRGPKPRELTEDETFPSFLKWQSNILYILNQDKDFKPFLKAGSTWNVLTAADPNRGFADEAGDDGVKKETKVQNLHLMLNRLAQWVPHYLGADIMNESTSTESIWQIIRTYYGFRQSEVQFMAFSQISWQGPDKERPERLYRRILSHLQDNLLKSGSKLKHNGKTPAEDEFISPTVERLAVLRWMELIHPKLPQLVATQFSHHLQVMTLKDIQPQIADGLDGFIEILRRDEIQSSYVVESDIQSSRINSQHQFRPRSARPPWQTRKFPSQTRAIKPVREPPKKQCRLCKAEGRTFWGHDMGSCRYMSEGERHEVVRSCKIEPDWEELDIAGVDEHLEHLDLRPEPSSE